MVRIAPIQIALHDEGPSTSIVYPHCIVQYITDGELGEVNWEDQDDTFWSVVSWWAGSVHLGRYRRKFLSFFTNWVIWNNKLSKSLKKKLECNSRINVLGNFLSHNIPPDNKLKPIEMPLLVYFMYIVPFGQYYKEWPKIWGRKYTASFHETICRNFHSTTVIYLADVIREKNVHWYGCVIKILW